MKCQKCGKESNTVGSACPNCNENYNLAVILQWLIKEQGIAVLNDTRALNSYILDVCRDPKVDSVVFEGLLKQGFSKRIADLYNTGSLKTGLDSYCNTLADVYNPDKIEYIADAFYFALLGEKRAHKVVQQNPILQSQNPNSTKDPLTQVQSKATDIINKIKNFDFKSFFSSLDIQKVKSIIKNNKKVSIGILSIIVLIIVVNIIASIAGSVSTKKPNITTTQNTYQTSTTTTTESFVEDTTEEETTEANDFSTSDDVSVTVYQDNEKSYYIKTVNAGIHRFSAQERTANYNVFINVYDLSDDRVMSETNEGVCNLEEGRTYKVTVSTDSPSCSFLLHVDRPNEIKNLTSSENIIHDSITFIDQCNVYVFSAPVSGRYRIDCINRTDGYNLEIETYNSNNERVFRETNGGYLDMTKGVVYTVYVRYSTGMCDYDIDISIPNDIKEISADTKKLSDKITFANQINTYTYTAPISGKYRFETNDRTNGYNVQLRIYDANNNRIVRETNNGTTEMQKGVKYTIEVEYETELCSYNLFIGVPNEVKQMTAGEAIPDSISFVDQENRYTFTPGSSGDYKIKASGRTNDYNVEIYIYDANNNRILRETNEGTVSLTAKTLYTIYVCYVDNLCDYSISIKK